MNDQTLTDAALAAASPSTALTVIRADLPTILANDTDDLLGKLAAEIAAFKADPTTPTGRKAIASMAYKVAATKATLIRLGKKLTEDWRRQTAAVNAECSLIESRMDALKEEVRAPLTEFENRERQRVRDHCSALADMAAYGRTVAGWSVSDIATRQTEFEGRKDLLERDWQEFRESASDTRAQVADALSSALDTAKRAYAEAAERERLRAEEAERKRLADEAARVAREEEIARAAAEAARKAAEEKAAREAAEAAAAAQRAREEAAIREQRARDAAAFAEAETKAARARAEAWRVASHKQGIDDLRAIGRPLPDGAPSAMARQMLNGLKNTFEGRDWQEFAEEAEKARAASQTALEGEQLLAEQREAAEKRRLEEESARRVAAAEERARLEERQHAEAIAAQVKAHEEARAADQKHKASIHRAIESAVYKAIDAKGGLDAQLVAVLARDVTVALAAGRIPNIAVRY